MPCEVAGTTLVKFSSSLYMLEGALLVQQIKNLVVQEPIRIVRCIFDSTSLLEFISKTD
jgi:hypothetical protein